MCRARIPHMTVEKFNTIALKIVQNLTCWIYIIRITRLVYSTFFLFLLLLISVESFLHNTFLQLYSSICFLLSEWTTIFCIICFTFVLRWVFVKCVLNNYCFFFRQSFVKFYSLIDRSTASDNYSTLLDTRRHCLIGHFSSKHRHKSSYYFTVASSTLFVFYCFPPIDICFYMIGRAWRVFQKCVSVSVNVFFCLCECVQCHTKWKPNNHDL